MNDQEMVNRYLYEVVKRVPQDSREEIRMELQALIEDMCSAEQLSAEEALQKLGAPDEFAKRYRTDSGYLIGPDYYDNYVWVIKIALAGVGISAVLSAVMQGIFHAQGAMVPFVVSFLASFFQELFSTALYGSFCAFAVITITFAVMERQGVRLHLMPEKHWSVKEFAKNTASNNTGNKKLWSPHLLPPVPDEHAVISRADSVVSIVAVSVFSALLLFAPQLFGAFHFENGRLTTVACIFNLDQWHVILPVFLLWLAVGLVDEIIRLVVGYYNKVVLYGTLVCDTLEILIAAILLKVLPLWNPEFAEQIKKASGIRNYSNGDLLRYWQSGLLSNILLIGICIVSLAEIGIAVYKTYKYTKHVI